MLDKKEYLLKNVNETRAWARDFAKTLHAPVTVALHGDLGMGKSEIAREIIKTLRGADTVVPSPTFTLVQNYDGISHFDLYRIGDASELEEIGLQYAIDNDITLIEWPDVAKDKLPENTIHVYITQQGDGRKLVLQ
ncbi:MAG: tRNA (adenosine(37)-N6)-threonylcarbamoyltransferase complex ATPase subunit type 1 TsaE [Alphaproteobacteria bacterium]|nr:tRNA (adenosine(37)-N6)-threonylcarbamoyltransferase complex ATPase subunit type 1 TsaE [Alphaproteobacteria bacterium]